MAATWKIGRSPSLSWRLVDEGHEMKYCVGRTAAPVRRYLFDLGNGKRDIEGPQDLTIGS